MDDFLRDRAIVDLDESAVRVAARALAVYEGDGRAYDEDPDVRDGFAERARLAVGIYQREIEPPA